MHGDDKGGIGMPPDDDWSADEGPMRGWVSPDDRLWQHPSERTPTVAGAPVLDGPTRPPGGGAWLVGGLAACIVVTLVISGMALATAQESTAPTTSPNLVSGVPTTEVDLSERAGARQMDTLASGARDSTVALLVSRRSGVSVGTGIVAEAGGIIAALRPTVARAQAITVVEADGARDPAVEVASDPYTGIVVLRIDDDLPVTPFTTDDPTTGSVSVAMAEEAGTDPNHPVTRLYAGTVLYAGIATGLWQWTGLSETAVAVPLPAGDLGSPLVEPSGDVAGIFAGAIGSGTDRTAIFLPAGLVQAVTDQLVVRGSVEHGTLDADVTDVPGPDAWTGDGAAVEDVAPGGAAAQAGLLSGDRIVAIDGADVHSAAELATLLYAQTPGTELPVTFVRDGVVYSAVVILGSS